jgi:hypothetical protein
MSLVDFNVRILLVPVGVPVTRSQVYIIVESSRHSRTLRKVLPWAWALAGTTVFDLVP